MKNDRDAEEMLKKEIQSLVKNKARELGLEGRGFGLKFLKNKKQKKKLQETKVLNEVEKSIRSRMLKVLEDLMGKRPALEVMINLVS